VFSVGSESQNQSREKIQTTNGKGDVKGKKKAEDPIHGGDQSELVSLYRVSPTI
jgi:hypothetical protein